MKPDPEPMGTSMTFVEKTSRFSEKVSMYTTLGATLSNMAMRLSSAESAQRALEGALCILVRAVSTCRGGDNDRFVSSTLSCIGLTVVDSSDADAILLFRRNGRVDAGAIARNFLRFLSIATLDVLSATSSHSLDSDSDAKRFVIYSFVGLGWAVRGEEVKPLIEEMAMAERSVRNCKGG